MTDEMKALLISNAMIMYTLGEMVKEPAIKKELHDGAAYINSFVGKEENHESD